MANDVYAAIYLGDIYKQTNQTGPFEPTGQTSRKWYGLSAAPNGDIWAVVYDGDIYRKAAGSTEFVATGQVFRKWRGIACTWDGGVYATVYNDSIYYKQWNWTELIDYYNDLGCTGMCHCADHSTYAVDLGGDIYRTSPGQGTFYKQNQTSRGWIAIAEAPDGKMWAAVTNGDLYTRQGHTGTFVPYGKPNKSWYSLTVTPNGDVYGGAQGSGILMLSGGAGDYQLVAPSANWFGITSIPHEEPAVPEPEADTPHTTQDVLFLGSWGF